MAWWHGAWMALWLAGGQALAAEGETGAPRRPPWGEGPPPWVKDGQVDEAARAAWLAKRREAAGGEVAPAGPAAGAGQDDRRADRRSRLASEDGTQTRNGGQEDHHHHAGVPVGSGTPAPAAAGGEKPGPAAARWGGGRDAVLWLTDAPPTRGGRPGGWGGGHGSGHGGSGGRPQAAGGGEGGGAPGKRVWLRQGANPLNARPATGEEAALLLDPVGQASALPVEPHGGPYNVKFPTPELGYYNVYFLRRAVDGDTLGVTAAKAEVVNGGMGHGAKVDASRLVPRLDPRVPVEIVRERKDKEALFTRINYGDEIAFQVLKGGQPVQNARVTFTSGQGWSNSVQSDEDGRAVFTVIRDYYTKDWGLFDKRHRETFLVTAAFSTPEAGEFQGGRYASTRYAASLSGAYYPGVADYESYSDGLMIGLAGLLFSGSGVWWYRRRRVRPYREVQFDD